MIKEKWEMFFIRKATPDDIETLAEIYVDIYKITNPIEKWTNNTAYAFISYFFQMSKGLFFVGINDKKIIGAVWGQVKPWWNGNKLYDIEIFIKNEFQNKGYSKLLFIKLFEESIQDYSVEDVEAITFSDRSFPLSYYERIQLEKDNQLVLLSGNAKNILNKLKCF